MSPLLAQTLTKRQDNEFGVQNERKTYYPYIRFKVIAAVFMKTYIFLDITPCDQLKVNRRFGGSYRLHLQVKE
jgi:hypothetical protein